MTINPKDYSIKDLKRMSRRAKKSFKAAIATVIEEGNYYFTIEDAIKKKG